jgi:hypothetical protein
MALCGKLRSVGVSFDLMAEFKNHGHWRQRSARSNGDIHR